NTHRLRPATLGGPSPPPGPRRIHRRGDLRSRPGQRRRTRPLRPTPGPGDLADQGHDVTDHRIRGPASVRRRQGPEVPQHPGDRALPQEPGPYGLDLAKRSIAKSKRVVVVEGYTDVMAAHLAGVDQAVATCGTAFGAEHVKIIRRLLGDDPTGQVVFTFDGDAAGQKAALKAFEFENLFT